MSMRVKCVICDRGAEFPRASARRCLTFPHGVYSAHRFSSRSFSSPTRCTGCADSPPVDYVLPMLSIIMGNCRHRLDFASWPVWPVFPLTSVSSYIGFASCQLLGFSTFPQGGARNILNISRISLNSAMPLVFMHCKESTTSTQAWTQFSRMWVGTLNQSTSRDSCCRSCFSYI